MNFTLKKSFTGNNIFGKLKIDNIYHQFGKQKIMELMTLINKDYLVNKVVQNKSLKWEKKMFSSIWMVIKYWGN